MKYARFSIISDPFYLNKTRETQGTFDECSENTCLNGGFCSNITSGRFACVCRPQYTGNFYEFCTNLKIVNIEDKGIYLIQ